MTVLETLTTIDKVVVDDLIKMISINKETFLIIINNSLEVAHHRKTFDFKEMAVKGIINKL